MVTWTTLPAHAPAGCKEDADREVGNWMEALDRRIDSLEWRYDTRLRAEVAGGEFSYPPEKLWQSRFFEARRMRNAVLQ